jgi:hypothetical protein
MKNWTIFSSETRFDFGKHKGDTLDLVAQSDAPYILWCVRKIDKFLILEEDLIECCNKYKRTIISILSTVNEEFVKSSKPFLVSDNDLALLKNKWEEYEEYLDMMDNADYDYYENYSVSNNPYYNDNLDMDQQDPEFWDSF